MPTCSEFASAARCALASLQAPHSAHSQNGEDILLLPTLLNLTGGNPGTFVELGALDGVTYSNTRVLEQCYGWHGLLIEANPTNFAKLQRSGRAATTAMVHSAVCAANLDGSDGTVEITREGGQLAGQPRFLPALNLRLAHKQLNASTVRVPCRPLSRLMSDAGTYVRGIPTLELSHGRASSLWQ